MNIRLIAEVPLGAFLSGGVDSSAIVALMASLSDKPVSTCSISFSDPEFNEAHYAAEVAQQFGTDHLVEEVDPDDYALVDQLAGLYDEPYADSSAMPTYRVCELARKRVTVALSGDGGDENFAGYRRYRWHTYEERLRSMLPLSMRRPLFGALGHMYPKADWAPKVFRAKSTFESLARSDVEGYFHSVSILGDKLRAKLFSTEFRRELQNYNAVEVFHRHAASAPDHPLSKVQYLDLKTYLVGDILTKVDRASMAHSLEVRSPFMDYRVVEFACRLPLRFKLKGLTTKHLLRKAFAEDLPPEPLKRQKHGFAVPMGDWFQGPLKAVYEDVVLSSSNGALVSKDEAGRLLKDHQYGRTDHGHRLWLLLFLHAWYQWWQGI